MSFWDKSKIKNQTPAKPIVDQSQSAPKPTTVIAAGTSFEGTLVSPDQVIIEGEFKGHLTAGKLLIREKAIVEGEFKSDILILFGEIKGGPVEAQEIILESTAHIIGNVNYERMTMKDGALVEGIMSKRTPSGVTKVVPMYQALGSKG